MKIKFLIIVLLILCVIYFVKLRSQKENYPTFDELNQLSLYGTKAPGSTYDFVNDWEFTTNSDKIIYKNGINLFDKWSIVEDPTDVNKLLFNYNAKIKSLALKINITEKNDFSLVSLTDEQKKLESNFNYNDNNVYNISYVDDVRIKKIMSTASGSQMRYYKKKPIKINNWYISVDVDNNLIFNYNKSRFSLAIDTNYNFKNIENDITPIGFSEFETFTNDNPLVIGNFKFYTIDVDNKPISIPTSKKQILIILNTSTNQSIPIFESNQTYFFGPDSGYYYNASSSEDRTIFLKTYTNIDKNICSGICDITDDCFAYNYYDSSKTCKLIKKFTTFENNVNPNFKTYYSKNFFQNPRIWKHIRSGANSIFGWKNFFVIPSTFTLNNTTIRDRLYGYYADKFLCGKELSGISPCTPEESNEVVSISQGIYETGDDNVFYCQTNDIYKLTITTSGDIWFRNALEKQWRQIGKPDNNKIICATITYKCCLPNTTNNMVDPVIYSISDQNIVYKLTNKMNILNTNAWGDQLFITSTYKPNWNNCKLNISNIKYIFADVFYNTNNYKPCIIIKGLNNSTNYSEENDVYYCNNIDNIENTSSWKKLPIKFKQACIAKGVVCGISPNGEAFIGTFVDKVNYNVNWMNVKLDDKKLKYIWNTGDYICCVTEDTNAYYCNLDPFLLNTFAATKSSESIGSNIGLPFKLVCPPGSYVTDFYGGASEYIDSIGIKCSNGEDLGSYGGNGGTYFESKSKYGFNKIKIQTNSEYVNGLKFYNQSVINNVGNLSSSNQKDLCCANKIVGIHGSRDISEKINADGGIVYLPKNENMGGIRQLGIVCGDEGINKVTTESFKTKYLLKSNNQCLTFKSKTSEYDPDRFELKECKKESDPDVNQLFDSLPNGCFKIKPTIFLGQNGGTWAPQNSCTNNILQTLGLTSTPLEVISYESNVSDEECKTSCNPSQILLTNETCVNRLQCGYNEEQSTVNGNCECIPGTRKYNQNTVNIYYDGDQNSYNTNNQVVCENNPENSYSYLPGLLYTSTTYTPI
jgi:hypothetical protein